ncbi:alkaline phosphatase [Sanguibacter sp. HDW7]|uniref:alkaline phosphatase n=1 Tax=Sanguibacter sp. HDW7 TaxID=2714931 RepID=UPI00140E947D|nr:alkaline phosphatase [Sanguibacter sp. HDW7]QIK82671.1 alkaline phosphatase [Sanguibacter sp. HDW7]
MGRRRTALTALVVVGAFGLGAATGVVVGRDDDAAPAAPPTSAPSVTAPPPAAPSPTADVPRRPRNVVLIVGDGTGDSEITAARAYAYGAGGRLPGIDAIDRTASVTTWSRLPGSGLPDLVPDSAATATGWATGVRTYDGAIGVDLDGKARPSLLELAQADGLRSGIVTTARVQDATPAAQLAHVARRECRGPEATTQQCPDDALENGGAGSITEQILTRRADVVLGGGDGHLDERATAGAWKGATLRERAKDEGFRLPTDTDGLAALVPASSPVLGLFADADLATRWSGPPSTRTGGADEPVRCTPNDALPDTQPTLRDMTTAALRLLDDPAAPEGFFLQVEGASIDKSAHGADPCAQIGETVDLDEAVRAVLDFARDDGSTLVVLTADHGQAGQIIEAGTTTPGLTRSLLTADDAVLTLSYGTSPAEVKQRHTGVQVPLAATGPGAEGLVGVLDQTEIFTILRDALELDGP